MSVYDFALPELGEGIEAGDVVNVLVSVGDEVVQDQPVVELETDKAVIEVPAPVSGTVQVVHVQAGDTVAVGQLIARFETDVAASAGAGVAAPAGPVELEPPDALADAVTVPWSAIDDNGEDAPVAASEAPPASPPAVPPSASPPPAPTSPRVSAASAAEAAPAGNRRGPAPASPSIRRLAREIGVDINEVEGSGPGGRIGEEDVKRHARRVMTDTAGLPAMAAVPSAVALPNFARWGEVERQSMSGVRRITAEHMAQAGSTIPHVTQHASADITDLEQLRRQFAPRAEALGARLTLTAIAIKVVSAALKQFPQFNASIDMAAHEIVYKKFYHIGVAVDTDRGLLVPVIQDVDQKNILDLAVELTELAENARSRRTTVEEMQGGTFTVTNLGGIGGTYFTPIINAPEVAILGIGRGATEPVYRGAQFEPRQMLPLSLSYDHRLIDGADGARFIRWVAEALQQPFLLALEG